MLVEPRRVNQRNLSTNETANETSRKAAKEDERPLKPVRVTEIRTSPCDEQRRVAAANRRLFEIGRELHRSAAWFSVAADTCSRSRDERRTRRGQKQLSSIPCALTRVLLGPGSTSPALTCLLTNTLCLSFSSLWMPRAPQHPEGIGAATLPEPQRAGRVQGQRCCRRARGFSERCWLDP